jgi:hypoxanthine phosphoribosyltransferase
MRSRTKPIPSTSEAGPIAGGATPAAAASGHDVPPRWREDIQRVLIAEGQIARRVRQLSKQIEREFQGRELIVVSLLTGTVLFLADLIRNLSLPLQLDFMDVSSYGDGTEPREPVITKHPRMSVRGRDVLLVDDILDTGRTLSLALRRLKALKPRRVRTCVLLNKAARRVMNIQADFVGFDIPDHFVVGYGLDFAERYRNLPFVGILHPRLLLPAAPATSQAPVPKRPAR